MTSGMAFQCPQCKSPVPASPTRIGQLVQCPKCQSEFRLNPSQMMSGAGAAAGSTSATPVPENANGASGDAPVKPNVARFTLPPGTVPSGTIQPATSSPRKPVAAPQAAVPSPTSQTASQPTARPLPPLPGFTPPSPPTQPKPPVVAVPAVVATEPENTPPAAKKVARLVATANAPSTVTLTTEGKLPELQLAETVNKAKAGEAPKSTNPIVLAAALTISAVCTFAILFMEPGGKSENSQTDKIADARKQLLNYYPKPNMADKPYQILLRESQRAYSRGDFSTERESYKKIILMLNAERSPYKGLTGTPSEDQKLKGLLEKLLASDES